MADASSRQPFPPVSCQLEAIRATSELRHVPAAIEKISVANDCYNLNFKGKAATAQFDFGHDHVEVAELQRVIRSSAADAEIGWRRRTTLPAARMR
jgi:hypothetical protein